MSRADFYNLREVLTPLSLHEVDFAMGDAFVSRIGDVKQTMNQIDTTDEPWVAEWLSAEHLKAGMLWTAAKTNWSREQSSGPDRTFNARTRAAIVGRFNRWVTDLQGRLDRYERSSRTETDVAEWRAALERFRKDPVNNP